MSFVPLFAGSVQHQGGFSPLSLSPALWLRADAGTLQTAGGTAASADGDPVGQWLDQSGNGRHVSQATASKRLTLMLAVQNGLPGLLGDGVDDELGSSSFGGVDFTAMSLYAVARFYTPAISAAVLRLRNSSTGNVFELVQVVTSNKARWAYSTSNGSNITDSAAGYTSVVLLSATVDGSNNYVYRANGAALSGTLAGSKLVRTVDTLNVLGETGSLMFGSYVHELIAYPVAHSASQVAQVEAYLQAKWGTP